MSFKLLLRSKTLKVHSHYALRLHVRVRLSQNANIASMRMLR